MEILGIDIGGSGIKAAPVDSVAGELLQPRERIATPSPSTPAAVAEIVRELVRHFNWTGPIGIGFPAIVRHQIVLTAANIDPAWIGVDGADLFSKATGCPVRMVNDADAAGLAEIAFGAGRGLRGSLILLTLGTGIGSALFYNGFLFPNSELGHIEMNGMIGEKFASAAVRKNEDLDWEEWTGRLNQYLAKIERLFAPDTIILGGGVSKKFSHFGPLLKTQADLMPAQLFNDAGIVGAAMAALRED